jgi:hypothetical protein
MRSNAEQIHRVSVDEDGICVLGFFEASDLRCAID